MAFFKILIIKFLFMKLFLDDEYSLYRYCCRPNSVVSQIADNVVFVRGYFIVEHYYIN